MVLKQWPMHTLIGKHTHACRVLQTCTHPYIHWLQTPADKLRLGQTDRACTLGRTRRHTADKTFIYIGVGWGWAVHLALSVFIALINAPLASALSSPWPRWPASFSSYMVIKWRRKWSSSPHIRMKTTKAAKNRKDLTPLQLKLNFSFCTPFHLFLFCVVLSWKSWCELVNYEQVYIQRLGPWG